MGAAGHRAIPHTADVRVEAWAPTREDCVAEAVAGCVETFAEVSARSAGRSHTARLEAEGDADLLAEVLNELIFVLETTGTVPVSTRLRSTAAGTEVAFGLGDVSDVRQVGAVPKAVSLHELRLDEGNDGWSCSVTLDV